MNRVYKVSLVTESYGMIDDYNSLTDAFGEYLIKRTEHELIERDVSDFSWMVIAYGPNAKLLRTATLNNTRLYLYEIPTHSGHPEPYTYDADCSGCRALDARENSP